MGVSQHISYENRITYGKEEAFALTIKSEQHTLPLIDHHLLFDNNLSNISAILAKERFPWDLSE